MEAGLAEWHQVDLNLERLLPTVSLYLDIPSSVQRIFTLSFLIFGASVFLFLESSLATMGGTQFCRLFQIQEDYCYG